MMVSSDLTVHESDQEPHNLPLDSMLIYPYFNSPLAGSYRYPWPFQN